MLLPLDPICAFGQPSSRSELRLPDAAIGGAAFAVQQLQLGHAQQVALIVDLLDRALPGDVIVLAQHGGQTQFLQVMFQQQLRRVGGMSRGVRSIASGAAWSRARVFCSSSAR